MNAPPRPLPRPLVFAVFVASGFAALLYQVIWQRALFTIFGTNIESVTVVVTAFMVGLGFGSLAGGALSRRPDRPVLTLFALIECAIGVYGVASLHLFAAVGHTGVGGSLVIVGFVTFALVLLPTLLMGSTLPLLVAHLVRVDGDVGQAVGWLYAVNTLGAALGAFAGALVLLGTFGMQGSVYVAAALNLIVGLGVLALARRAPRAVAA
ncbi:MAG: fused MFS/spermidine synthase [Myxococcales bacterium]|nr:fused MFS/spermidine synthase [Myxococcales bacterium]